MHNKNLIAIAGVVALILALVAIVWLARPFGADTQHELPPAIVGALVQISDDRSSVTIASQDGRQETFAVSYKTRVTGMVKPGEVARSLQELTVGDVLAVITSPGDTTTVQKLRVMSPSAPTQADTPTAVIMGTLISQTATSITLEPQDGASALVPGMTKTFMLSGNTVVLAETLATQAGRSLADVAPGDKLQVTAGTGDTPVALVIEIPLAN